MYFQPRMNVTGNRPFGQKIFPTSFNFFDMGWMGSSIRYFKFLWYCHDIWLIVKVFLLLTDMSLGSADIFQDMFEDNG